MASEERRLAAIMVTDIVGYSRRMGEDEAGTVALVRAWRRNHLEPCVSAHNGRIVKLMGDGALVEFSSAVNAVLCAEALRQPIGNGGASEDPGLVLRIGINLGEVIGDGADILGDGVNIAARLESQARPGAICISAKVFEEVRGKTSVTFEDRGEVSLKNIQRPVRVFETPIVGRGAPVQYSAGDPQEKQSIAVLPFVSRSADPDHEFLADSLTEDIITELSRFGDIWVTARNSTFQYRGTSRSISEVGRELKAGHVLEGSVRVAGGRVRIQAQLGDTATGHQVWAEKYDCTLDEIVDVQDQIIRSVATSVQNQIVAFQARSPRALEHIPSPAYRLAMTARTFLFEMTANGVARGEAIVEQALALDPDCALAHRMRANAMVIRLVTGAVEHDAANTSLGIALCAEAIRRDPRDEWAHWLMGLALAEAGQFDAALIEFNLGLELNPNASMILGDKGDLLVAMGDVESGIAACTLALRLNPRDPIGYWWENTIATGHLIRSRPEQALELARRVMQRKPDHARALIVAAAAAGILERDSEAKEIIARCGREFPELRLGTVMPRYMPVFSRPADNEIVRAGLLAAGLPE